MYAAHIQSIYVYIYAMCNVYAQTTKSIFDTRNVWECVAQKKMKNEKRTTHICSMHVWNFLKENTCRADKHEQQQQQPKTAYSKHTQQSKHSSIAEWHSVLSSMRFDAFI